jgi:dienelactone hydrolase
MLQRTLWNFGFTHSFCLIPGPDSLEAAKSFIALHVPGRMRELYKEFFFAVLITATMTAQADDVRVEIASEGWTLVGDLTTPETTSLKAFALLLHKAAGDRRAYVTMAEAMAARGIASLRIDLRGHGDSVNLGAFDPQINRYLDEDDPAIVRNFSLIRSGDRDIVSIIRWLEEQPNLSGLPLIVVGSSYTGEEMVEAAMATRFADIYVALSPGSFSEESIAAVDRSEAPWLFVRAEVELPFFPELFAAIRDGSETAEIWVLPGEGHATDLFDHNPNLHLRLIDWTTDRLGGVGPP